MMWPTRILPVAHQVEHSSLKRHSQKNPGWRSCLLFFFFLRGMMHPQYPDVSPTLGRGDVPSPTENHWSYLTSYCTTPEETRPRFISWPEFGNKVGSLRFLSIQLLPFPMSVCSFFWYQSVFLLQSAYVIEGRHHMLLMMVLLMLFFSLNIHCLHSLCRSTCNLSHALL